MIKNIISNEWQMEMALEAIDFAKRRKTFADYKDFCNLQPLTAEKNYYDRIRIMDTLIDSKFIIYDGGSLAIGVLQNITDLHGLLQKGNKRAWMLAQATDAQPQYLTKFDSARNEKIGLRGEKFVFDEYRKILPPDFLPELKHLSLISDNWGYDIIAPSIDSKNEKLLLEVKTTSLPVGEFRLFLSAHEFKISQESENWYIVLVRIIDNQLQIEGHFSGAQLASIVPSNINQRVKWHSLRILVDPAWVHLGLPH